MTEHTAPETITVDLQSVVAGDHDAQWVVSVHLDEAGADEAVAAHTAGVVDELRRGARTSIIDSDLHHVDALPVDFTIPREFLTPAGIAAFEALAAQRADRLLAERREVDEDY